MKVLQDRQSLQFYKHAGTWFMALLEHAKSLDQGVYQKIHYDDGSRAEIDAAIEPDGTIVHMVRIIPRSPASLSGPPGEASRRMCTCSTHCPESGHHERACCSMVSCDCWCHFEVRAGRRP